MGDNNRYFHRTDNGAAKEINPDGDDNAVIIPTVIPKGEKSIKLKIQTEETIKDKNQIIALSEKGMATGSNKIWAGGRVKDLPTHEVVRTMAKLFPNINHEYVVYRHMEARGYDIQTNQEIHVEGQEFEEADLSDVDFVFVDATQEETLDDLMQKRYDIFGDLPEYDRYKLNIEGKRVNNIYGRSFVVAVLSESGKIYAMRVTTQFINPNTTKKHSLSLHRFKNKRDDPTVLNAIEQYQKDRRKFNNEG